MNLESRTIRLGTRGSKLALTQAHWVADKLRELNPSLQVDIEIIRTSGDHNQTKPFTEVGVKGMFVKELEQELLSKTVDVAVHCLKDMPAEMPLGLEVSAFPKREDPHDALISSKGLRLSGLPFGAVIGTSSARRKALLLHLRADFEIRELRGNLDTRLKKLETGEYDAIVLAAAGLNRMGWSQKITETLSPEVCLPAVGQGTLALQCRVSDATTRAIVGKLHDQDTNAVSMAERGFLQALGGGCSVPAAAYATLEADRITLQALVASTDGSRVLRTKVTGLRTAATEIGERAAQQLIMLGAKSLLVS